MCWAVSAESTGKCKLGLRSGNRHKSPSVVAECIVCSFLKLITDFSMGKSVVLRYIQALKICKRKCMNNSLCVRLENLEYFGSALIQPSFQLDLC